MHAVGFLAFFPMNTQITIIFIFDLYCPLIDLSNELFHNILHIEHVEILSVENDVMRERSHKVLLNHLGSKVNRHDLCGHHLGISSSV